VLFSTKQIGDISFFGEPVPLDVMKKIGIVVTDVSLAESECGYLREIPM